MFDYKSESLAHSITAENAEMREELLKQELLATQISLENAEADTERLDWVMPLLCGDQPGDAVAVDIGVIRLQVPAPVALSAALQSRSIPG